MRLFQARILGLFLLAQFVCGAGTAFATGQERVINTNGLEYTGMRAGGSAAARERVIDTSGLEYTGMRAGGSAAARERVIDTSGLEYIGMRMGGSVAARERVINTGALEYTGMRAAGSTASRERVIDTSGLEYTGMRTGGSVAGHERVVDTNGLEYIGQRVIQNNAKAVPTASVNETRGSEVKAKRPKGAKVTDDVVRDIKLIKITPRSGFIPFKTGDVRNAFGASPRGAKEPVPAPQGEGKQIPELRMQKRNMPPPAPDKTFTPQTYGAPNQGKP